MSRHNHHSADHAHRFAFEGTVLERVLLTIIKAHTSEEGVNRPGFAGDPNS